MHPEVQGMTAAFVDSKADFEKTVKEMGLELLWPKFVPNGFETFLKEGKYLNLT